MTYKKMSYALSHTTAELWKLLNNQSKQNIKKNIERNKKNGHKITLKALVQNAYIFQK